MQDIFIGRNVKTIYGINGKSSKFAVRTYTAQMKVTDFVYSTYESALQGLLALSESENVYWVTPHQDTTI